MLKSPTATCNFIFKGCMDVCGILVWTNKVLVTFRPPWAEAWIWFWAALWSGSGPGLSEAGGVMISERGVNLWVTARPAVRLDVYEADNSWRRRLAVIQSTQQMASVWLTAAVTSRLKQHGVGTFTKLSDMQRPQHPSWSTFRLRAAEEWRMCFSVLPQTVKKRNMVYLLRF